MPAPPPKDEGKELDPEKIALLVATLDRLRRKQRLMIAGYLGALVLLIGGLAVAFYLYGTLPESRFKSMVFFIPLGLTAILLWAIGRLSRRSETPGQPYKKP